MIQPPFLEKGDTIGIVACAGKISLPQIQSAIDTLISWELKVVLGKNIFNQHYQFSGTDDERFEDLQVMINDPTVKAVISARGGYGTIRIIDKMEFNFFTKNPKWIIGYSDITILHSHIHNFGIQTIHATMPINFANNSDATESLRKALFGEQLSYEFEKHVLNRKGSTEAQIIGGTLSILNNVLASISDIDTKGKILFIEDVGEYLYHIDRMIITLKRAGKLNVLAGLIVGGFTEMKDNTAPFGKSVEEIIFDAVREYNFPVCFNFPTGHIEKNMALYFGRKAKLEVNNKCTLDFI